MKKYTNRLLVAIVLILGWVTFQENIFDALVNTWKVSTDLPETTDYIVPLNYGAYSNRLMTVTRLTLHSATTIADAYPGSTIVYGSFSTSRNASVEEKLKRDMVVGRKTIDIGPVLNTTTEAKRVHDLVNPEAKNIVVLTDECHSRSALWIWKRWFEDRKTQISLVTVPCRVSIESDSPVRFQRNKWTWLAVNIGRQIFLWFGGFNCLARGCVSEPVVE